MFQGIAGPAGPAGPEGREGPKVKYFNNALYLSPNSIYVKGIYKSI